MRDRLFFFLEMKFNSDEWGGGSFQWYLDAGEWEEGSDSKEGWRDHREALDQLTTRIGSNFSHAHHLISLADPESLLLSWSWEAAVGGDGA